MNAKTAIIIVNWNQFFHTNNCIDSIKKSNATDYDIIIVDNASTDHSGQQLKEKYPSVILLQANKNLGFAGGNNLGLKYSIDNGYRYSFLLNNDTFVDADFLNPLVELIAANAVIGAIQPRIYYNHDRTILWNGGSYYNKFLGFIHSERFYRKDNAKTNKLKPVDCITGCAFFIKNEALLDVGLLNEHLFMYYEDTDLSLRLHHKKYKLLYQPQSVIYHIAGASGKEAQQTKEGHTHPTIFYYSFRNRIWFLKKYTPLYCIPTCVLYNLMYFTACGFYFLLRRRFKKCKVLMMAIRDGFMKKGFQD